MPEELLGIAQELDDIILDFAFLATHYSDAHPANAGDVSQVLPSILGGKLRSLFVETASDWYGIDRLEALAQIRADGRIGYRSQGIKAPRFYDLVRPIADRVLLITSTGSQLPAIGQSIASGKSGQLLTLVEVDENARQIRILYGNREFGAIPSIETHVHLVANAISIEEGLPNPAVVHAHPYNLNLLARHRAICGKFDFFNAIIYTQIEGILRNYPGLVGLVPYFESGSEQLVINSLGALLAHRMVLWMNHGFVVRAENIRRAYILLSYAEDAARAALDALEKRTLGLPFDAVERFLSEKGLMRAYTYIRSQIEGIPDDFLQTKLFS